MQNLEKKSYSFSSEDVNKLVHAARLTVNNLYEVLEACSTDQEAQKISGSIYLLEESLYGQSNMNPFVQV